MYGTIKKIGGGDAAILKTLQDMREKAITYGHSPGGYAAASTIVVDAGVVDGDQDKVTEALYQRVRKLPYIRDPHRMETVRECILTLFGEIDHKDPRRNLPPGGDCDDKAALLMALLLAQGVGNNGLCAVEFEGQPVPGYSHVYNYLRSGDKIVPMDATYHWMKPRQDPPGKIKRRLMLDLDTGEAVEQMGSALAHYRHIGAVDTVRPSENLGFLQVAAAIGSVVGNLASGVINFVNQRDQAKYAYRARRQEVALQQLQIEAQLEIARQAQQIGGQVELERIAQQGRTARAALDAVVPIALIGGAFYIGSRSGRKRKKKKRSKR